MTPVALMSCMRNEGIHILEWLAYHRVIGFGPIVICSNDCDDGSDHLLDLLAHHGLIDHLPNPLEPGEPPQRKGIDRALVHLQDSPADWLAHLDADEFLNIAPGAGPVQELIDRAQDAHAIALPWRMFGDNGHQISFNRGNAGFVENRAKRIGAEHVARNGHDLIRTHHFALYLAGERLRARIIDVRDH